MQQVTSSYIRVVPSKQAAWLFQNTAFSDGMPGSPVGIGYNLVLGHHKELFF